MLIDGYRKEEEWVVHSAIQGALLIPPPSSQAEEKVTSERARSSGRRCQFDKTA